MKSTRSTVTQQGFTITQMVITIAIISVVSTFGVLGIRTARAEFRLQNSARLFASYVEKARADAIRRHAESGQESSVETFGPGSTRYDVTMDWGSGTVETRSFDLESGLSFNTAARKVIFNWRGRISEAWVFQIRSDYLDKNLPVDVSGSGDITVGEQHFPDQLIPDVEISQVTGDVAGTPTPTATPTPTPEPTPEGPVDPGDPPPTPEPTPEVIDLDPGNGDGHGNGGSGGGGIGNPNASPTPTPAATPSPAASPANPQCVATLSPSSLSLSQSDTSNLTGTATLNISSQTGTRTISASLAGNGNSLNVGLSLVRIDGSGTSVITVTTKNGAGNRGVFIVNISADPACGSPKQLSVSVSN
jgi:type II secretory pathway pseudopilin PulG